MTGTMSKDEVIQMQGEVDEHLPRAMFRMKPVSGQGVLGHISGKMRMQASAALPGTGSPSS